MDNENRVQNKSSPKPGSESKVGVGQKRVSLQTEETSPCHKKRVKLGDLQSAQSSKAQEEIQGSSAVKDFKLGSGAIDLHVNTGPIHIGAEEESRKVLAAVKEAKNRRLDLDLNANDIYSSLNDPLYPYKSSEHLKLRDDVECASSVGSLDDKDSMKVWEGLKQNNYLSSSYGAVTNAIPKQRGKKKSNNDAARKLELAKKEQVDRFAKVAAPSGLLHGLNPGIINHVRNRKQVHAIIEALVKSERTENQHLGSKNSGQSEKENSGGIRSLGISHGNVILERRQIGIPAPMPMSNYLKPEFEGGYGASLGDPRYFQSTPSRYTLANKNDSLALKLSSGVAIASENTSCLSNEESGSITNVDSLSVKAANVALQWLELLIHDIKGRLAALKRSKRRVRIAITKEVPSLLAREFSSNAEDDSCTTEGSTHCHFGKALVNAHAARWTALFGQMDKALSEEESYLENWLREVNKMYSHCERGLYKSSLDHSSQEPGPVDENNRLGEAHNPDEELAMRAAAASIYSTCNYLLSMENWPPFC